MKNDKKKEQILEVFINDQLPTLMADTRTVSTRKDGYYFNW